MSDEPLAFSSDQFSGQARMFPLPNLVMFPHVMQALHIFEPRYRALFEEAIEDDRLIALGSLAPGWEGDYEGRPPLRPTACLCRIRGYTVDADGTVFRISQAQPARKTRDTCISQLKLPGGSFCRRSVPPVAFADSKHSKKRRASITAAAPVCRQNSWHEYATVFPSCNFEMPCLVPIAGSARAQPAGISPLPQSDP